MNSAADRRLVEAVRAGNDVAVAQALADGADPNATVGPSQGSVLTEAVSCMAFRPGPAALATLRVLLEAGAAPGPAEEAPLITAVMRPVAPAVLRLLLAHGADVDQRRSDAPPAIVVAARRGDHAAVDVLLAAGADADARDGQGRTALMHAVERNERRGSSTSLWTTSVTASGQFGPAWTPRRRGSLPCGCARMSSRHPTRCGTSWK